MMCCEKPKKDIHETNRIQSHAVLDKLINKLLSSVVSTLGPHGRLALIESGGRVKFTKDGISVLNSITGDKHEQLLLKVIKESCANVNDQVGDGTTTFIVLLSEIYKLGMKRLENGVNKRRLTAGISLALEQLVAYIESVSIDPTDNDLRNVAKIAANNDSELGDLVYKGLTSTTSVHPKYKLISVEENKSMNTQLEFTEGIKMRASYLSPYFLNEDGSSLYLENVVVVLINGRLSDPKFVVELLNYLNMSNKSGLIVCDDIEKNILNTLIINNYQKVVRIAAIKLNESDAEKKSMITDLAIIANASILDFSHLSISEKTRIHI